MFIPLPRLPPPPPLPLLLPSLAPLPFLFHLLLFPSFLPSFAGHLVPNLVFCSKGQIGGTESPQHKKFELKKYILNRNVDSTKGEQKPSDK